MSSVTAVVKIVVLALLVVTASCSKEESGQPVKSSAAPEPTAPVAPSVSTPGAGVGTITGKVVFKGSPAAGKVAVGKDKEVCGDVKLDPSLVLSSQGEVKNAVIQIAGIKQAMSAPRDAVLDQVKCEYTPHVIAIPVGATVKIKNSDGILHNVHSFSEKNTPFNRAQPKYLKEIAEKFTKPEVVSLRCDVHGWMSGWIVVTESPFFAVTADEGAFKMENVPVGIHQLEVWHESLGKASQALEVKPGEVTNVTFEFKLKK